MKYFKAEWNESRGDEYDSWGTSIWFLELDEENNPIRQIEVYQNGNILKYDSIKMTDDFGMLGDQAIQIEEMNGIELSQSEFESQWEIESSN
tara:strand:+ start:1766 stop:2041 length:276 start_codon:yes stop_codon:yes gene_type:complete